MNDHLKYIVAKQFPKKDEYEWALLQISDDIEHMNEIQFDSYQLDVILQGKLCWNHASYDKIHEKEKEYDTYIQTPLELEEGVLQCKKCKSKKVFSFQIQTRSADEPMTTIARCSKCGVGWTENN